MAPHQVARDIHFTRWLFRAYLLLLFLLPLPLGGNRPLFWSLFVAGAAGLSLAWAAGWLAGVARWPTRSRAAWWTLLPLGLFVVWSAVRLAPPEWLAPVLAPAYLEDAVARLAGLRSGAGGAAAFSATADAQASADELLLSLGLFLLAALTIVLVRSGRRALLVLKVLVLAGLLQAVYGTLMILSGFEWGLLAPKEFGRGVATGTYINRNHYANLLLLSLSAGAGLMLARMDLQGAPDWRNWLRGFLRAALGPKARLRVYLVLMVIALVLTRSRMGNTAFFAALTATGLFALWRLRRPSRPLLVLVVSVLVVDVLVVGTWFGVEQVIDRIQQTVEVQQDEWVVRDGNRIDADRESLEIIRLAPLAGFGGGTFYTVYPPWRGADQQFMDHAHNDYLELVIEYGLIGVSLLAWFLLRCLFRAARGLRHRVPAARFGVAFASFMAMTAMLMHATVDFSLHLPANAAWFVVLCLLPHCRTGSADAGRRRRFRQNSAPAASP